MVLPQFTLRMVLALVAVAAFVSLLLARGLQGASWAMGITVAIAALAIAFLTYAAVFGLVYAVSTVFSRRSNAHRPMPVRETAAGQSVTSPPRDNSNLTPPASESI